MGQEIKAIHTLGLEGAEENFHDRVIPTIALSMPHATGLHLGSGYVRV